MALMDITTADFEREVLEASKTQPVVVDFWATWCGPCRVLGPIIEKVAADYTGRVKLVKVDSDQNPELSAAFGIRSIPTVIAFKDGRPAAQFLGAQPEGEVRAFFEQLTPSPSAEALARAEAAFEQRDLDTAERELAAVSPDPELDPRIDTLKRGIAYARGAADGVDEAELARKLAADPLDHDARLALAKLLAGERRYREAMDALLEILHRDKNWHEGIARRELVTILGLAEKAPDLVAEYRRKLASALH